MGYKELTKLGPAIAQVLQEDAELEGAEWKEYYRGLEKDGR